MTKTWLGKQCLELGWGVRGRVSVSDDRQRSITGVAERNSARKCFQGSCFPSGMWELPFPEGCSVFAGCSFALKER